MSFQFIQANTDGVRLVRIRFILSQLEAGECEFSGFKFLLLEVVRHFMAQEIVKIHILVPETTDRKSDGVGAFIEFAHGLTMRELLQWIES
ncbi:hypothetical protein D3C72_1594170 [compost metagenome]